MNGGTPLSLNTETPLSLNTETPLSLNTETPLSLNTETPLSLNTETPLSLNTGTPLAILLLLLSAPAHGADAKAVLQKLGEDARARENAALCTYLETTIVNELGKESQIVGAEVRLFEVDVNGTEVTRRDLLVTAKTGEPLADLLHQQRDTKGKKPARSPLHPEAQVDYLFELKDGPGPDSQTLTIEPVKPSTERVRGAAVVNKATLKLETLQLAPSKVPMLLKSFAMGFEFTDTACGRQPVVIDLKGEGVAVFIETKFASRTVLTGHTRAAAPAGRKK